MRIDTEFNFVLTEPFLIGDESIGTAPDISTLNLAIGEYWYGQITDEQCSYVIRITNTDKGYIIEQGVCESEPCDANTGACLDTYCCGEICDALEEEREKCCIKEIVSTDLEVEPDPDDCSVISLEIAEGIIPDIPDFCFLESGRLVVDINGNSVIFFCEDGQKFGIKFSDLCTALAACSGGGDVTINETNNYLDVSDFDANFGGMVIENGVIQTAPPDWYNNLATEAEVNALIGAIVTGVLSVDTGPAIVDTGTATVPDLDLQDIHGSAQSGLSGNIQFDKYGRVTSVTSTAPWGGSLTGGNHITLIGTSINHDNAGSIASTLPNGTEIDSFGHVIGQNPDFQIARWCGNPSGFTEDKAVNVSGVPVGANVLYTLSPAMPDGNWMIVATDNAGNPVSLNVTGKTASNFSLPNTLGQLCFAVFA